MNHREFFGLGSPFLSLFQEPVSGLPDQTTGIADRDANALEPFVASPSDPWDYAKAAHLVRRCTIGATAEEVRMAMEIGMDAMVLMLLEPFAPDVEMIEGFAGHDPQVSMPSDHDPDFPEWARKKAGNRELLCRWWLKVIATSPPSIQERMTLFWHGHFVSQMTVVEFAEFMYCQNTLFRRLALGNFKELVQQITRDMAMLLYLNGIDNHVSWNGSRINENYARELMELFTMGVYDWQGNQNYSQKDVVAAARSFSGWCYRLSPDGEYHRSIRSQFIPDRWDSGEKTFLGHTGRFNDHDIIDIIFSERGEQIARFICEKLYRAFVNLTPNRSIIAAMARTFIAGGWELGPVMEQLLKSRHFYDANNIGCLHKSAPDFYVGLLRNLGIDDVPDFINGVTDSPYNDLTMRLQQIGHMPFLPPHVKGWAGGRDWTNGAALPIRQKFAMDVAEEKIGHWNGQTVIRLYRFDPLAFARSFPNPHDINMLCDDMARCVLAAPPSAAERRQLYDALLDGGAPYEWSLKNPAQRPAQRIRKFLKTAFKLPKHQLY